jgi:hypothetical protein
MTSTTPRTIERRDAAVAAALAGAVLVIVGYASGIGIRPAAEVTATLPERTAPSTATEPAPAPQVPVAVAPPVAASVPVPVAPATTVTAPAAKSTTHPQPAAPGPRSSEPTPADPTACPDGLVTALVDDLHVGNVTPLVTGLLRPVLDVIGLDEVGATCPSPDAP